MSVLQESIFLLNRVADGEFGRIAATAGVLLAAWLSSRALRLKLSRNTAGAPADVLRGKLVWSQNVIRLGASLVVTLIWASKIAGAIVSVAALAGAFLIVNKELFMCLMGYMLVTLTRPYKVGDYIEVGGNTGRVIDVNAFSTVLSETGSVNQLTGKTLSVPNGLLFVHPVRNTSHTGEFIVSLSKIALPADADFDVAERCARESATTVTEAWLEKANAHMEDIEKDVFLDLPSSRIKVLWETPNEKQHLMTVRFACPMEQRVAAEQAIYRGFWRRYRAALQEAAEAGRG